MTKDQIAQGLREGRQLAQEEWADQAEKDAVDQLCSDGLAIATPFAWRDGFQCAVRFVRAKKGAQWRDETGRDA